MNKAFEKILERLDEERKYSYADFDKYVNNCSPCLDSEYDDFFHRGLERSIKVIKEVSEECKDGWIPCSERLPEIRQDCLVTVRYTGFMGMHGFLVKTGHMEAENDWLGDCSGGEVIAWQPLPEPYKE